MKFHQVTSFDNFRYIIFLTNLSRITSVLSHYLGTGGLKTWKESLPNAELVCSDLFSLLSPCGCSEALHEEKKIKKYKCND